MVDFAKLREQNKQRVAEEKGAASTSIQFFSRAKTELELLIDLQDQDLNNWEDSFVANNIQWLKKATGSPKLSFKQRKCLDDMVFKYNIEPDKKEEVKPAPTPASIKQIIDEDDIPF